MDSVRRRERRCRDKRKSTLLDGTRYLWLKNRENLTESQMHSLDELLALFGDLETVCVLFVEVFRSLREKLGNETYARIFPLLLTDNGSEFTDPLPIEMDSSSGQLLSAVFYCEPRQSQQKGSCENNHEFIRRIIPRGKSMNNYNQEKIDLMMSHINSYLRAELGGHSPYDVFSFMYGPNILDKLNIRRIDPSEVTLKPSLLD